MEQRGLRSVLEPALYIALAMSLHAVLFLIPGGGGSKVPESTVRGIRVRTFSANPAPPSAASRPPAPMTAPPAATPPKAAAPPTAMLPRNYSVPGGASESTGGISGGTPGSTPAGAGTTGGAPVAGAGGGKRTAFDDYMRKLGSTEVQGWAKESAAKSRKGWKGSGGGGGGWGSGTGAGVGDGTGGGGSGTGGRGTGGGGGGGYLDPRVRMVVTSYPPTSIEKGYKPVPYPDLRLKKYQLASGWWNVYIEIRTDGAGNVTRMQVLRPETDGPSERIFVGQVQREIARWSFDPQEAEIHVDVRFYVE